MIEVKNITKSFEGRTVLNNISAVFETGKTNLIIGRSGSGKTVLIKNIIGLMKPDSGEILYDGRDLTSMGKLELNMLRREMGMLFQGSALFDSMIASIREKHPNTKVIVGGAPLNATFAQEIGADAYARDPQDNINWLDSIVA